MLSGHRLAFHLNRSNRRMAQDYQPDKLPWEIVFDGVVQPFCTRWSFYTCQGYGGSGRLLCCGDAASDRHTGPPQRWNVNWVPTAVQPF